MGEGGKGEENQYQIEDIFVAARHGPMMQFRNRLD